MPRARSIAAVIPEPADQAGHRRNRGSRGGRPVGFDAGDYKNRNVIERAFNQLKNWRGIATRYDKHARWSIGAASSSHPSCSGYDQIRDTP